MSLTSSHHQTISIIASKLDQKVIGAGLLPATAQVLKVCETLLLFYSLPLDGECAYLAVLVIRTIRMIPLIKNVIKRI